MTTHLRDAIEWISQQADLGKISTLFGATESALGICALLGGGTMWLITRYNNSRKRLRYTVRCGDPSSVNDGWTQYLREERCPLPILWSRYPSSIPGSYYPRNVSLRKPLSWPCLIAMRLKAAVYRLFSRSPPFRQHPAAFFRNDYYAGLDPVFDVLIENITNKDIVIVGVGIEICSVAHIMNAMGSPPARKIESIGDYQVNVPDINEKMRQRGAWSDGRVLETQSVNERVFVNPFSDRISLEAGGHMRYTLQLNGYARNVPSESIIRLFLESTGKRRFWSDFIRISHIGADD
jgi:hypothetical protein